MLGITLLKTKFKIKILYRSGNSQSFWVYDYHIHDGKHEWTPSSDSGRPIIIGVNDIEAVYQVAARMNIFSFFKDLYQTVTQFT